MSNYNYFYNFHNRNLAQGLFTQAPEVSAAPPPPTGNSILTDSGDNLLTDSGDNLLEG